MSAPIPSAASLLLLRDSSKGPELLMTRRAAAMRSWAGNWVFPGGRAESCDRDPCNPQRIDMANEAWDGRCTAVRETFEETGALVATSANAADRAAGLSALRAAPSEQFFSTLAEHGFELQLSNVLHWSHWIAPLEAAQRYDTHFYVAALLADDPLMADQREAPELAWWRPQAAIDAAGAKQIRLAPPTLMNLFELQQLATQCDSVAELLARSTSREFVTIFPRIIIHQGERWALYPWDKEYTDIAPGGTLDYIPRRYQTLPSRLLLG